MSPQCWHNESWCVSRVCRCSSCTAGILGHHEADDDTMMPASMPPQSRIALVLADQSSTIHTNHTKHLSQRLICHCIKGTLMAGRGGTDCTTIFFQTWTSCLAGSFISNFQETSIHIILGMQYTHISWKKWCESGREMNGRWHLKHWMVSVNTWSCLLGWLQLNSRPWSMKFY